MSRNIVKVLMLVALMSMSASPSFSMEKGMAVKESPKVVQLREAMRDLWIGHVFWVRNVALATRLGETQGAKVAEAQVVGNARSIADAVIPFYGKPAADKLFALLAGHYGATKEYMTASYAGNQAGKDAAAAKLKANAEEIAAFLSSANPNWPKPALVSLLTAHVGHHMAQIDSFRDRNYASEARIWGAMKDHMYMIADALTAGLAKQFPKKL